MPDGPSGSAAEADDRGEPHSLDCSLNLKAKGCGKAQPLIIRLNGDPVAPVLPMAALRQRTCNAIGQLGVAR
jgi:hypothetical protein